MKLAILEYQYPQSAPKTVRPALHARKTHSPWHKVGPSYGV
jgi:hypothetical protein